MCLECLVERKKLPCMLKSIFNQNKLTHFVYKKSWRIKWLDGRGIELESACSVGLRANQHLLHYLPDSPVKKTTKRRFCPLLHSGCFHWRTRYLSTPIDNSESYLSVIERRSNRESPSVPPFFWQSQRRKVFKLSFISLSLHSHHHSHPSIPSSCFPI